MTRSRPDAVEGVDFVYVDHPENPGLKAKAWLGEDGEIIGVRSQGDDGRLRGQLITRPPVLVENEYQIGDPRHEERRMRNAQAISDAITEWADRMVDSGRVQLPGSVGGRSQFALTEEESTKAIITLLLDRLTDQENPPPLRDMNVVIKDVLVMADRLGKPTEKRAPPVAIQVNLTPGLLSKGFGS